MHLTIFNQKRSFLIRKAVDSIEETQSSMDISLILAWVSIAIGIISIVIGAVISFFFYRLSKTLKLIIYDVVSDTPLVSIRTQTKRGHIKILYDNDAGHSEELHNARLVTISIQNIGNVDVKIWNQGDTDIENMEEPVTFEFVGGSIVALTQIITTPRHGVIQPDNFDKYINTSSQYSPFLGLPRCLLKSYQSILLGVIVTGLDKEIKVHGKLYNGDIKFWSELNKQRQKRKLVARTVISIGIFIMEIGLVPFFYKNAIFAFLFPITILAPIVFLVLSIELYLINTRRRRNRLRRTIN